MIPPSAVAKFVISHHRPLDYTLGPIISLVYLFQKCVYAVSPDHRSWRTIEGKERWFSHEYSVEHLLQNKSWGRCFVLLVPVLGSIVIALHDWKTKRDAIQAVGENHEAFNQLLPWLKKDKDVNEAATLRAERCFNEMPCPEPSDLSGRQKLGLFPEKYLLDRRVLEAAMKKNQMINVNWLPHSSPEEQSLVLDVVRYDAYQFEHLPASLITKENVLLLLKKINDTDDKQKIASMCIHNQIILRDFKKVAPEAVKDGNFQRAVIAIDSRLGIVFYS